MTQNKFICKECNKQFRVLTKDGYCAYCYYNKYKTWATEFTDLSEQGRRKNLK